MKQLVLAFLLLFLAFPAYAADEESVYERVMRTGKIRCGYGLWSIYLSKDPNTGEMSGMYYDYMETLGERLHLKIEWAEEIGWGDFIAALDHDRFDVYCTLVAYNAERARQVDYVSPILFLGADAFVKAGDTRFDNNMSRANAEDIRMTVVEGDIYNKISVRDYPLAQKDELPQLATQAELFLTIANGKSDITMTETSAGEEFMAANPGKIQKVKHEGPLLTMPASIAVKGGEYRFQRMLDIATMEMLNDGTFARIIDKYDPERRINFDVTPQYKVKK